MHSRSEVQYEAFGGRLNLAVFLEVAPEAPKRARFIQDPDRKKLQLLDRLLGVPGQKRASLNNNLSTREPRLARIND